MVKAVFTLPGGQQVTADVDISEPIMRPDGSFDVALFDSLDGSSCEINCVEDAESLSKLKECEGE